MTVHFQLHCLLYDNFRPLLAMTVHFQLHCLLSTHQTTLTLPVTNGYFSISFGEDILSFDDCGRGRPFVKGVLERILIGRCRVLVFRTSI
ncbi:hypothetical protein E4U26_001315 [Claviceps purpurea]|nr:hypothetical protein E4U26_001315 [Claviceps purpurea]